MTSSLAKRTIPRGRTDGMNHDNTLISVFSETARAATVSFISIGLGYTAVGLDNGNVGLCHTMRDNSDSCTVFREPSDFEGAPALALLERIRSSDPITRSVVIALVNALNHGYASACPDDADTLAADLALGRGSKLAMVGYFAPVVSKLTALGVEVRAYDTGKGVGDKDGFYAWARTEARALILTATSVIDRSIDDVFDRLRGADVPCVLMGPSTIMRPEAFQGYPVHFLAGTVAMDNEGIFKAIRNGKGTPELLKHGRKVYIRRG